MTGQSTRVEALRNLGRALEIGARLGLRLLRLGVRWPASRWGGRRRPFGGLLGEELAGLCEDLGPTFVKIGQILSSRPDLLSDAVAKPLARLQNDLAPVDARRIPALVEESLGRPLAELFARFDGEPLASASVAQVHGARLHDGREVVVKVRRPGIVATVDRDFRLLRTLARWFGRLPGTRAVPMLELVEEIGGPIREQLDFRREADNLRRFHANFARIEHITLPILVEELSSGSVLTLERLDRLERVTSGRFSAEERRTAALAGLRALYRMIFIDGLVHADLHPGNVFLRAWGEVVILDLGLVAELTAEDQQDFVDFFFGLVNNQGEVCARIVYDSALYRSPRCDRARFERAMVDLVARHSALRSSEFEVTGFVFQLMEVQRRFGIRGSTKFIMTVLAMVVYDGICKQLYPECDFQQEARGYLIAARYGRGRARAAI